jgi:peptidoglycan/xylan/chitin deacetylase (PgdA/CDA1 family)
MCRARTWRRSIDRMNLLLKRAVARAIPLRAITACAAPVLTYHACYRHPPAEVARLDNLTPEWLYEQISTLKKAVRFIPIDELAACKTRKGVAAITFDDGYRSVIEEAMPLLVALDVPFTIFVNTYALEGRTFWRHKVTYILNNGLTQECEAFIKGVQKIPGQSFYNYLKDPRNNSGAIERELDRFLEHKRIQVEIPQRMASRQSDFVPHRLVWYGNHTHRHYVMASLSGAEQRAEIEATKTHLERIPGIQLSRCLALPFGRSDQANQETLAAMRDAGYRVLLMNRGGVNFAGAARRDDIVLLERFSVNESPIAWDVARQFGASVLNGMTAKKATALGSLDA